MRPLLYNLTALGTFACLATQAWAQQDTRPNIIVILADDLGYSDLGCYGGEIQTPNLDRLAREGLRFNSFYNAGRSCPTRASLLTGLYPHQAGIGRMTFNDSLPGYRGQLTDHGVTLAEVMKEAGYQTGMVGKWHVAETSLRKDQRQWLAHQVYHEEFADKACYPVNRGFEDFYGIIYGVADYFDPFSLVDGETPVRNVPKDYYITCALSDSAVSYVNRYARQDKPFFLYLAYTAPHWPLHALPQDIKKYENTYKDGWDAVRQRRYERMRQLGIFPGADHFLSPRQHPDKWVDNPTKEWDARAMAVHAAMVDRMDQGIGQLLDALQKSGELDNTLILFLSDNGCSNEICQNYSEGENDRPDMTRLGEKIVYPRHKEVLPGTERTYASVGPIWANVANTPFRFWKAKSYEGGINTPCIAFWPKGMKAQKGSVTSQRAHVIDIMATCIELGRAVYPAIYNGKQIRPMEGRSLVPVFQGEMRNPHEYLGFEHFNEKALISKDGWKIVQPGKNAAWELYNLNEDRTEMHNVATRYPEKLEQLVKAYEQWAERCLVVPAPD